MRTSYPFCAWALDIMKGREEEGVLFDEKQLIAEASIFREDIFGSKAVDQAVIASPVVESDPKTEEEKALREIFSNK